MQKLYIINLENIEKNKKENKNAHSLDIQRPPLLIHTILILETCYHTEHTALFPIKWNVYISIFFISISMKSEVMQGNVSGLVFSLGVGKGFLTDSESRINKRKNRYILVH